MEMFYCDTPLGKSTSCFFLKNLFFICNPSSATFYTGGKILKCLICICLQIFYYYIYP